MDELKGHVDQLFAKHKGSRINELKEEVLGNLQAKVEDLLASGMEYNKALETAKKGIRNIDYLIDDNKQVFITLFRIELIQIALIYTLIGWILTIPLRIIRIGIGLNVFLMALSIIMGLSYIIVYLTRQQKKQYRKKYINCRSFISIKKISWIVWSLFIIIMTLVTIALYFGSNIWFSRAIVIDGPYQFAEIATRFLLPFVSIILPMVISTIPKIIIKHEVGESNEI